MHTLPDFSGATHDPKFQTVSWFGAQYNFSPPQAKCVGVLWRFWMLGTPIIREEMVLESAGVRARSLKDVFASPPGKNAWGRMIDVGDRRGTVQLVHPISRAGDPSTPAEQELGTG
jgi:hypothetical protein